MLNHSDNQEADAITVSRNQYGLPLLPNYFDLMPIAIRGRWKRGSNIVARAVPNPLRVRQHSGIPYRISKHLFSLWNSLLVRLQSFLGDGLVQLGDEMVVMSLPYRASSREPTRQYLTVRSLIVIRYCIYSTLPVIWHNPASPRGGENRSLQQIYTTSQAEHSCDGFERTRTASVKLKHPGRYRY